MNKLKLLGIILSLAFCVQAPVQAQEKRHVTYTELVSEICGYYTSFAETLTINYQEGETIDEAFEFIDDLPKVANGEEALKQQEEIKNT